MKNLRDYYGSGWYSAPNWVSDEYPKGDPDNKLTFLDDKEKAVLDALFRFGGSDGMCDDVSKERIAAAKSMSVKSVQRALNDKDKLKDKELVDVIYRPGRKSVYVLNMEKVREWSARFHAELQEFRVQYKCGQSDQGHADPGQRDHTPRSERPHTQVTQSIQHKTKEKKQQQQSVVDVLLELGIRETKAIKLAHNYNRDRIEKQIKNYKQEIKRRQKKNRNLPRTGWLIGAIEEDWEFIPDGVKVDKKQTFELYVKKMQDDGYIEEHGEVVALPAGLHRTLFFFTGNYKGYVPYSQVSKLEDIKNLPEYNIEVPGDGELETVPGPSITFIDGIKQELS